MISLTEKASGIYRAMAYVNDVSAVEALVAPMPHVMAQSIKQQLDHTEKTEAMKFDAKTRRAFFVRRDTKVVECWTWNEIPSLKKAAEMWAMIVSAGTPMNFALAKEVFTTATDQEVSSVQ